MNEISRRHFLEFLGAAGVAYVGASLEARAFAETATGSGQGLTLTPIGPGTTDELALAPGFKHQILIKFGDVINARGERFGSDNDFTALVQTSKDEGYLWVNHEGFHPLFVSGYVPGQERTKEQVEKEMDVVGGSILKMKRDVKTGDWRVVQNDPANRRLDARTEIPFAGGREIADSKVAIGTMGNCCGGVTPWKTILTCEENVDDYYGDIDFKCYKDGTKPAKKPSSRGWERFYERTPMHYGWVVEVDPATGKAKKHVALGRFAHEGALVVKAKDGRPVVYMGDDMNNQCIYKFVAAQPDSLENGTLYVADVVNGKWLPLDIETQPKLNECFKDQTEVLVFAREAAKLVGGTPMDRPEGIALNPRTGELVISLTNNMAKGNSFGSLLRLAERGGDYHATEFTSATLLAGGPETGFACPDNVVFDRQGNLWFTCDVSEKSMHKEPYTEFGNNALFVVPVAGKDAGKALRVASAPFDAEFTGPSFSADFKTLFLSVQHPGLTTTKLDAPTSQWPVKGEMPRSAVIAITGGPLAQLS